MGCTISGVAHSISLSSRSLEVSSRSKQLTETPHSVERILMSNCKTSWLENSRPNLELISHKTMELFRDAVRPLRSVRLNSPLPHKPPSTFPTLPLTAPGQSI